MGITGLIPFLDKASSKINIGSLKGTTVAIDTYCWLHKGAFACAEKLVRGETTDIHINYCLKYVNMLLKHDIKPILVFDGRHLPAKALTEAKRRESRQSSRKRAAELLRLGKTEEARSHLRRCVDITHEMALQLIKECRKRNVDCIVAPYEADAQLAFLNTRNIAQYVITEDSDLVLFGCSNIIFKLDLTGSCLLVESSKLYVAMGCHPDKYNFTKFRHMCILSGCDYLDSLPGIGLAKACKFVLKTEETDLRRSLLKVPAYLNMRQLDVTQEYIESFLKADATFQHMIVFDPLTRKATRLNDPAQCGTDLEYCSNAGEFMDDETAFKMALGNLNPFSLKKLDDYHPDCAPKPLKGSKKNGWNQTSVTRHKSIWESHFEPHFLSPKGNRSATNKFNVKAKQIQQPTEPLEVRNEDSISEQELLAAYVSSDAPPRKRQKLPNTFNLLDDVSDSPKKHNPFAKPKTEIHLDCSASPTKITESNRSLLKNVSPVKRIAFKGSGLKKLSQFNRTIVDDKKRILSRFFSSNSEIVQNTSLSPNDTQGGISFNKANEEDKDSDYSKSSKGSCKNPAKCENNTLDINLVEDAHKEENDSSTVMPRRASARIFNIEKDEKCSPIQKRKIDEVFAGNQEDEDVVICLSSPESLRELNEKTPTKSPSIWVRTKRVPLFKLPDDYPSTVDDDHETSDVPSHSSPEPSCSQSSESTSSQSLSQTSHYSMRQKSTFGTQNLSPIPSDDGVGVIDVDSYQKRASKSPKVQRKPSQKCRRPGLSKSKSQKAPDKGQCRLSMFGFQKKIQLPAGATPNCL